MHLFLMKSTHLRTLSLLLLAALLLLSAPAVADSSQTTVTLTACEVAVVKDSSAHAIVFTINGESGITSAFVAKGESVTISVASIPSGKNLVVSCTGDAELDKSGMTIIVSNVQSERVTVTMKLESAGGSGGGGVVKPPKPPIDTGDKVYTAFVEENGDANFHTHKVIYRVTVPEEHEGERIDIIDRASVKTSNDMDVYHQADIKHHFDLAEGDTSTVHFRIPLSDLEAKGLGAEDACLYHYISGTGWTKLPTVYTVVGDTVYYESEAKADGAFAVVFEEGAAKPKDSGGDEPVTPQPPEVVPCEPCYICIVVLLLILLAGIGAAVILRRRKNVEKQ